MKTFFAIFGVLFWILLAQILFERFRNRPAVQRFLDQKALYPYTQWFFQKYWGTIAMIRYRLGLIPRRYVNLEHLRNSLNIKLSQTKRLRDAYARLDRLPTIEKGKKALGLDSIFEVRSKRVKFIESPYTHPLQDPPFFIPGVPAKPWHDPADYEFVGPLEEAYPVIKKELLELLDSEGRGFQAYVNEYADVVAGWNTFNFFFFGEKFEENCARCPETTAVLESLPGFEKDHIMFSALNPHSVITPHYGPMNGIIRAHLPLIVPNGCYIKVGDEERPWEEGKVMVFDDSFLHQVWNHSDHLRIVLFLNFWDPVFSPEEVEALEAFRRAYEDHPIAKQHAHNQRKKRPHSIKKKAPAKGVAETVPGPVAG